MALPSDQPSDWPAKGRFAHYNNRVREESTRCSAIAENLESAPAALVDGTLLNVAIEHRLMHTETLAYLLHELPFDRKIMQPMGFERGKARA